MHVVGQRLRTLWGWGTVVDVEGDLVTVALDDEERNVVVSADARSDDIIDNGGQRG